LNSLKIKLYKRVFKEVDNDFEFLRAKNNYSCLENSISLNHTTTIGRLNILVDYGGIYAWLGVEEPEFVG